MVFLLCDNGWEVGIPATSFHLTTVFHISTDKLSPKEATLSNKDSKLAWFSYTNGFTLIAISICDGPNVLFQLMSSSDTACT